VIAAAQPATVTRKRLSLAVPRSLRQIAQPRKTSTSRKKKPGDA
jgi:hypothetical protein